MSIISSISGYPLHSERFENIRRSAVNFNWRHFLNREIFKCNSQIGEIKSAIYLHQIIGANNYNA